MKNPYELHQNLIDIFIDEREILSIVPHPQNKDLILITYIDYEINQLTMLYNIKEKDIIWNVPTPFGGKYYQFTPNGQRIVYFEEIDRRHYEPPYVHNGEPYVGRFRTLDAETGDYGQIIEYNHKIVCPFQLKNYIIISLHESDEADEANENRVITVHITEEVITETDPADIKNIKISRSPNGESAKFVAVATENKVILFDISNGPFVLHSSITGSGDALEFSDDESLLIYGGGRSFSIYDIVKKEIIFIYDFPEDRIVVDILYSDNKLFVKTKDENSNNYLDIFDLNSTELEHLQLFSFENRIDSFSVQDKYLFLTFREIKPLVYENKEQDIDSLFEGIKNAASTV